MTTQKEVEKECECRDETLRDKCFEEQKKFYRYLRYVDPVWVKRGDENGD